VSAAAEREAAGLAALIVTKAVQNSHLAALPECGKAAIVRRAVGLMLAAGAYIEGGALFLPSNPNRR
jgi:hypothetical protein